MDFKALAEWKKSIENMPPKVQTACPVCSERLEIHPRTGEVHCPYCGWPYSKAEAPV